MEKIDPLNIINKTVNQMLNTRNYLQTPEKLRVFVMGENNLTESTSPVDQDWMSVDQEWTNTGQALKEPPWAGDNLSEIIPGPHPAELRVVHLPCEVK